MAHEETACLSGAQLAQGARPEKLPPLPWVISLTFFSFFHLLFTFPERGAKAVEKFIALHH